MMERSKSWKQVGDSAEQMVAELTGGTVVARKPYDVLTASGIRLQVKGSSLYKIPGKIKTRLSWNRVLDSDPARAYDRLILVGEVDDRFAPLYRDTESLFLFFDIPVGRVLEVVVNKNKTEKLIQISTNSEKNLTPQARLLFDVFQVTPDELRAYRKA
jgi:hypothetical protein